MDLHMFFIGDSDYVVADSIDDAWSVWEETTNSKRGEAFDDVDEACELLPDDKVLACSVDGNGEPCEIGEGSTVKKTAIEWARQLGRCLAFSDNY